MAIAFRSGFPSARHCLQCLKSWKAAICARPCISAGVLCHSNCVTSRRGRTCGRIVGRASVERPEMASPVNKGRYTALSFSLVHAAVHDRIVRNVWNLTRARANLSALTKTQTARLGGSRNSRKSTLARLTSLESRRAKRKFVTKHADLKFGSRYLSQTAAHFSPSTKSTIA